LARIAPNMFVTCFYAILDPKSGSLTYANAGHSLPCCRREDAATDLSARGMPLGLMPGMSYEEKETVLGPGKGVLFYTDGLIEAHNPQGEMFGTPRLRGLLRAPDGRSGPEHNLVGRALLIHRRGVGAGGRHHPPYPGVLRHPKLNFREFTL
jgi:serine phosphatase RsbU (regulator of sigma subunit)